MRMRVRMTVECCEPCTLESQVRANIKLAVEKENPAYRCTRIEVRQEAGAVP